MTDQPSNAYQHPLAPPVDPFDPPMHDPNSPPPATQTLGPQSLGAQSFGAHHPAPQLAGTQGFGAEHLGAQSFGAHHPAPQLAGTQSFGAEHLGTQHPGSLDAPRGPGNVPGNRSLTGIVIGLSALLFIGAAVVIVSLWHHDKTAGQTPAAAATASSAPAPAPPAPAPADPTASDPAASDPASSDPTPSDPTPSGTGSSDSSASDDVASWPELRALPGSAEASLRFAKDGPETKVAFVNTTAGTVSISWLDTDGKRVEYATLKPGDTYTQKTYVGHFWVAARTDNAEAIAVFQPTTHPCRAIIR
ncbi:VHL beta domain-containing protein [Winogradskya humida]|uniref:von Hippel-Lindau disease tumour suppressor beta domain-containing protein n=1 Tax=Winogradskya humida TaxID=113566 RepID=A0ABQ4A2Q6_9ACTN|nr:hypothetical protein [Actinoplanes humidus]GIE25122.1 hypothetical protein Ahu01nite_082240 [Actinoplanes humidus]